MLGGVAVERFDPSHDPTRLRDHCFMAIHSCNAQYHVISAHATILTCERRDRRITTIMSLLVRPVGPSPKTCRRQRYARELDSNGKIYCAESGICAAPGCFTPISSPVVMSAGAHRCWEPGLSHTTYWKGVIRKRSMSSDRKVVASWRQTVLVFHLARRFFLFVFRAL